MNSGKDHPPPAHGQSELDRAQAVADLDQGITDREQARVDRDQEPLDAAQAALSSEPPVSTPQAGHTRARQAAELALAQERQDAHQAQLDQTQLGQGARQDVLDRQQADLEEPSHIDEERGGDEALQEASEELQQALRSRAEETLLRADQARQRAADTLARLDATQRRE